MQNNFMCLAIEEAEKGRNHTFTNPLVGAVIVKNNQVIAKGAHLEYGRNHAERNAIEQCPSSEDLLNSTLYVTLEPCSHFGKQPPCSELIVNSGIKKVVIGQLDPNPLVAGQGKKFLEDHGIEVIVGVEEEKVRDLNETYNFYYQNHRPYVVLKQAITLDGRISANRYQRTMITGQAVWKEVHRERAKYQGILVGSQTILTDDPTLAGSEAGEFPPIRMVLDRRGRILQQTNLAIFKDDSAPVWIFTEQPMHYDLPKHIKIIHLQKMSVEIVLEEIAARKLQSVYVEGGAAVHDAFLASGCWEEMITYLTPKLLGGNSLSSFSSERNTSTLVALEQVTMQPIGNDFLIRGRRKG